ncbi:Hypothetical predicted protein [Olea europaea subsp. europaea]|uniref:Uncharacterized protein n=1 Tax=Olea europaea subsp. europaea TaxID=158383 RepID=A0A8S0QCM8_OLEEU|nr:Hypothetical predicted protein [Olea europaea subsp. europaea]
MTLQPSKRYNDQLFSQFSAYISLALIRIHRDQEGFMGSSEDRFAGFKNLGFKGSREDRFAGFKNIAPNCEWMQQPNNTRSPILDVKSETLAVEGPSCEKPFHALANLTVGTAEIAAAAEKGFNAGANSPVQKNRKSNKKTRNKRQLKKVAAAAADRNYTPPKSVEKRKRACDTDSDSKDDPPRSKKSKVVVNRPLKFNK